MARGRRSVNRPKETTFLVALIVAAVGVLAYLNVLPVPELRAWAFWIVVLAFRDPRAGDADAGRVS